MAQSMSGRMSASVYATRAKGNVPANSDAYSELEQNSSNLSRTFENQLSPTDLDTKKSSKTAKGDSFGDRKLSTKLSPQSSETKTLPVNHCETPAHALDQSRAKVRLAKDSDVVKTASKAQYAASPHLQNTPSIRKAAKSSLRVVEREPFSLRPVKGQKPQSSRMQSSPPTSSTLTQEKKSKASVPLSQSTEYSEALAQQIEGAMMVMSLVDDIVNEAASAFFAVSQRHPEVSKEKIEIENIPELEEASTYVSVTTSVNFTKAAQDVPHISLVSKTEKLESSPLKTEAKKPPMCQCIIM